VARASQAELAMARRPAAEYFSAVTARRHDELR
jgi:hypothetical protein